MSTLQERFQALRARRPEISNADLARLTGAKPPSVGDWFNGETKSMKANTAAKVAAVYSVNPMWLATGNGEMLKWDGHANGDVPMIAAPKEHARAPMSAQTEHRLTRFLAVLYQLPEEVRESALSAAIEVLLDRLPQPPRPRLPG